MIIHTTFSMYELEPERRRMRRLHSFHEPTPNQKITSKAGWKTYRNAAHFHGGLLFRWSGWDDGVLRQTLTGVVTLVECSNCGKCFAPEASRWLCPVCGWKEPCCDGAPLCPVPDA